MGGSEHNIFKSHYGSIVQSIAEELTQDNLRLDSPVKKIEWSEQVNFNDSKPIVVTLQDNNKILTNCVIVTCSLGFLKENHNDLFIPTLPLKLTKAIESMGFGVINKVFLDFDEPWWDSKTKGFQFLWKAEYNLQNSNPIRCKLASWTQDFTGFDVLKDHRGVLLGWIGGKGAYIVETLSEKQIIEDCTDLFRYFLKNDNVPEAKKCLRSCWASNQFIKGGYSHITKKCDITGISPAVLAEPVWGTISFDGKNEVFILFLMHE